jgi:hypothetical protein
MRLNPLLVGKLKSRLVQIEGNRLVKFKAVTKQTRLNGHSYYVIRLLPRSVKNANIVAVALYFQKEFLFFIFPREFFDYRKYLCLNPRVLQNIYEPYRFK